MDFETIVLEITSENIVPESTVEKKEPVLSFEEWDASRLSECTDLLLA